jgi:hypothetical protein
MRGSLPGIRGGAIGCADPGGRGISDGSDRRRHRAEYPYHIHVLAPVPGVAAGSIVLRAVTEVCRAAE